MVLHWNHSCSLHFYMSNIYICFIYRLSEELVRAWLPCVWCFWTVELRRISMEGYSDYVALLKFNYKTVTYLTLTHHEVVIVRCSVWPDIFCEIHLWIWIVHTGKNPATLGHMDRFALCKETDAEFLGTALSGEDQDTWWIPCPEKIEC